METDERIKKKLRKLEVDMESLKPYLVKHLREIEEEISRRNESKAVALKQLKQSDYDVKSIAGSTGISRTTFYNYDRLLQKYVELSHEEDYNDDPYVQIREMRETIRMLQEEKGLMQQRDCQELRLKEEIKLLKQQLSDKDKTINNLRKYTIKG